MTAKNEMKFDSNEKTRKIVEPKKFSKARFVAISGIMIALETVMTILVAIRIPATQGYFNLGEMIIYISAIVFGPIIGFLTGAIGAGLADIILGYSLYAPATFVIKGFEGYIVGLIYKKFSRKSNEYTPKSTINDNTSDKSINNVIKMAISILPGAIIMVLGYFLFQIIIGVAPEGALVEVPINIIQCVIGALMTIIIVPIINKINVN
jgi:uncharacterized membrane protein